MERDALKHILQNPYKRELWIKTVQFLSGQKNALTIFVEPKHISLHTKKQQEIVRELIQLGTLKTTDNVELPIFEIQLQENVKIEYNRVGVNELIKEYILKDAHKGAIATYYHKDNSPQEWRFSFISKYGASDYFDEAESIETTPKKYTYIFGTPEAHRTALERLFNLKQSSFNLEDFFEAFNVEPVSKNFFKEYKNFYLDIVHHLATTENRQMFETGDAETEKVDLEIRNFVKRLLGRLVFLYFLQKKNWLGATNKNYEDGEHNFLENLFNGNYGYIDRELFYGDWLSKIFFNALNTPNRTNDGFELPNDKSVWIPFLNGGLFEENQEPKNHKKLKIPAFMFGELFHFFNGYNFTIYENSPEDHIVAVDPEMLGNIFENLLEDNSDKGTFYTPKEIVHYMTQESLIEYLNTKSSRNRAELENLVKHQNGDAFSRENLIEIESLIDKVKICDPAIGSGAFPMGLLQEIFALKAYIHFQLGYDIWSPAKIKQDIIQNSIYGVDLEAGAVDIARLRFWLSLVVDEPTPKPLPNLDYKIMQGNSLIEEFAGIDLSKLMDDDDEMITEQSTLDFGDDFRTEVTLFDKATKADFQNLLNKYFAPEVWEKKHKQKVNKLAVKKEINDIVEGKIHAVVHKEKLRLASSVGKFEKDHNIKTTEDLVGLNKNSKNYKIYDTDKSRLTEIDEIEQQLVEFQHTDERPYFLWHVFFANVFDQGGFDIVIGNPPYVEHKKLKHISRQLKEKYEVYSGTADLSLYFFELSFNILNEKGAFSFINTNKFFNTGYGRTLRNYLNKKDLVSLVNFEQVRVFEDALVSSVIVIAKNTKPVNKQFEYAEFIDEDNWKTNFLEKIKSRKTVYNQEIFDEREWVFVPLSELKIKTQIETLGTPIKNIESINIKRGVTTGFDPAFIIDKKDRHKFEKQEIIKDLLKGKEIKRYFIKSSDDLMLFIPWHYPLHLENISGASEIAENKLKNTEPNLYSHLNNYKRELSSRNKSETGIRYEWYALQRCAASYFELFDSQKILWPLTADKWGFALDTKGFYLTSGAFFLVSEKLPLKYILAVLNSKVMKYYFKFIGVMTAGGAYTLKKASIDEFPIIELDDSTLFVQLAELVTFLTNTIKPVSETIKNSQLALFFEEVIDGCIYELYFEEEMQTKGVAILNLVKEEISKVFENPDFEKLDFTNEKEKIWQLYNILKDGEIQKRMRQFVSKSPEVLKPIIQHK